MNMSPSEKQRSANAISGKTARACDNCLHRRARWYCAADDAFLCQACDSSVHSANLLARRHDRVRLKTASSSPPLSDLNTNLPTWHQGFKRKARTPRHAKSVVKPVLLVPDLETLAADEKVDVDDEEEQLLYRVPIFDPVLAEFCSPLTSDDVNIPSMEEEKPAINHGNFIGFDPSDIELAEFAADVENLLGRGLEDDSFCIDGLGLLEAEQNDKSQVKTEMIDGIDTSRGIISNETTTNFLVDMEMELSGESLDFNFDCGSPITGDEVEEQKVERVQDSREQPVKIGLRLDYSAVMDAWSNCGCSPWKGGERPQLNLEECWPDFTGMWGTVGGGGGEVQGQFGLRIGQADGGREARVLRYREKRRTRFFSKKIRYEVRKLNAEKRPRMKGRFVKRTIFPSTTAPGASAVFPYA